MVGGTPHIPPLEGGRLAGVVVVTFTDIVGGSRGSGPCKDTTGSRVFANASSRGPSTAICLSLMGSLVVGPQVSFWCVSDSDSDGMGVSALCSVRLVVCIDMIGVS